MPRTEAEIKRVIQDVKQTGFTALKAKHEKNLAQIHRHTSYSDELIANLDEQITTRIALPSRRPQLARRQIAGILRASYSWHVEPKGDKTERSRRRADLLELYFAGIWQTVFRPVIELTLGDQTVGPFGAWWIEWEQFRLPAKEEEREAYRKSYQPFRLQRIDPKTAYFLRDEQGRPTIAVREFEIPYVEFAKRYGKGEDTDPLIILNQQFPGLRANPGQDIDSATSTTKRATVCIVDDSVTICHYVKLASGEYQAATDEVPNPWGRPSLFIVPGQYNAEGQELVDVYTGLLEELLGEQKNLDVMRSHMASLAFTANKFGQVVPPEVMQSLIDADKPIPAAEFKNGMASLIGAKVDFSQQPGQASWELMGQQVEERNATLPPPC